MSSRSTRLPVLIVDAYNVIAQDAAYRDLFDLDADTARARLVDDVASHAAGRFDATVVFDAHGNPTADGEPHEVAGITVVFSPAGIEADAIIEARAHAAAVSGDSVVVVTSDSETRHAVGGDRVQVMQAGSFVAGMRQTRMDETAAADVGERSPIEDRLDATTREALMRWACGG